MDWGLGTKKSPRVNQNLELSDLELSEVNLVTLWRKKVGTVRKNSSCPEIRVKRVWVNESQLYEDWIHKEVILLKMFKLQIYRNSTYTRDNFEYIFINMRLHTLWSWVTYLPQKFLYRRHDHQASPYCRRFLINQESHGHTAQRYKCELLKS